MDTVELPRIMFIVHTHIQTYVCVYKAFQKPGERIFCIFSSLHLKPYMGKGDFFNWIKSDFEKNVINNFRVLDEATRATGQQPH
jgi:hypothetical protein